MMQKNKKNILIIKHGALGDLIQSIGFIMAIRQQYPESIVTLLTAPAYCQLMQRCPYIDHIVADNRAPIWRVDQQIKLKKKLQKQKIDLVFDLQNSDRSRMYQQFWFSKVEWVGRSVDAEEPESGLSGLMTLMQEAGISTAHAYHPDLLWMVDDVSDLLTKESISQDYIVLIPGSSAQHLDKRWPHYAALAAALIKGGDEVVVVLGPDESDLADGMPGHVVNGLNWFELAGVLNEAKYVIGNDTGPCHIASYLNKKGFAIFGPATSASRSEIGHRNFKAVEVEDLASFTVAQALEYFSGGTG